MKRNLKVENDYSFGRKGYPTLAKQEEKMPQPECMLLLSRICEQQMLRHAKRKTKKNYISRFFFPMSANEK